MARGNAASASKGRRPSGRAVVGHSPEPPEHVGAYLGERDRYLSIAKESIADPHARVNVYGRRSIEIERLGDAPVTVITDKKEVEVVDRAEVRFDDWVRLGTHETTVKQLLQGSLESANAKVRRRQGGLSQLVEGRREIESDFGALQSRFEFVDEANVEIDLLPYERDVLVFCRPDGAAASRVTVLYAQGYHQRVIHRTRQLERAGYTVDERAATSVVIREARQAIVEKQSQQAVSEESSELYKEFCEYVSNAIERQASDVHIEVRERRAWLRFRVNGELKTQREVEPHYALRMCSAVYNQAIKGGSSAFNALQTQQGKIDDTFGTRQAGLRVQVLPCAPAGAFDFVARISLYDTVENNLSFEYLGYHGDQARQIYRAASRPQGALVIAGTTGSGKSQTLDTILRDRIAFYQGAKKVITAEEPVERVIPGATQIEISRATEETKSGEQSAFAQSVTAAMRSDPDLLMVQEVRDPDTAQLFARATMSGHAVYTTTHTGDPFEVISRFVDLGMPGHVLKSAGFFNLIMHQSLVPLHCHSCARTLDEYRDHFGSNRVFTEFADRVAHFFGPLADHVRFRGPGCPQCQGDPLRGRTLCAEVVEVTDDIRECLSPERLNEARSRWLAKGSLTSFAHGVLKALDGELSPYDLETNVDIIPDQPLVEYFREYAGEAHPVIQRFRELGGASVERVARADA